jgi:hypothetical protein
MHEASGKQQDSRVNKSYAIIHIRVKKKKKNSKVPSQNSLLGLLETVEIDKLVSPHIESWKPKSIRAKRSCNTYKRPVLHSVLIGALVTKLCLHRFTCFHLLRFDS